MTTITANVNISSERVGINSTQDEAKVVRLCALASADGREVHVEPDAHGQIRHTGLEEGLCDVEREVRVHALVCRGRRVPSGLTPCTTTQSDSGITEFHCLTSGADSAGEGCRDAGVCCRVSLELMYCAENLNGPTANIESG